DNAASNFIHRAALIFRQIAHFGREFYCQATTDGSMLAKLVQCLLVISQYAVAVVTFAGLQHLSQSLVICGVMTLKHVNAKRFFRAKVVIEGPFRHFSSF